MSNAFARSRKTASTVEPQLIASVIRTSISSKLERQDLLRMNPCWWSDSKLMLCKMICY